MWNNNNFRYLTYTLHDLSQGESDVDNTKSEVKYTKCISTWLDDSGKILPENIEKETDHLYQSLFKSKAQWTLECY